MNREELRLKLGLMVNEYVDMVSDSIQKSYTEGFNDALDILDGIIVQALDVSDNRDECQTLRWVFDEISVMRK